MAALASLVAPTKQEMRLLSLGWEDSLEKEVAAHSSILAWEIPGQKSLAGYSPWVHKESDTTKRLNNSNQVSFKSGIRPFCSYLQQGQGVVFYLFQTIWLSLGLAPEESC